MLGADDIALTKHQEELVAGAAIGMHRDADLGGAPGAWIECGKLRQSVDEARVDGVALRQQRIGLIGLGLASLVSQHELVRRGLYVGQQSLGLAAMIRVLMKHRDAEHAHQHDGHRPSYPCAPESVTFDTNDERAHAGARSRKITRMWHVSEMHCIEKLRVALSLSTGLSETISRDARPLDSPRESPLMVTVDDVRALASTLPRSYEVFVHGRVKFRVGRIVYLDFSRDGTLMGFAFPREWRPVLLSSDPRKFVPPRPSDVRYNWVQVRLAAIDASEMRELVLDAWEMVVPKTVTRLAPPRISRGAPRPTPRMDSSAPVPRSSEPRR